MERDLYVDNIVSSIEDEETAIRYFYESRKTMSVAEFNLRSWSSNSDKIRELAKEENVPDGDQSTKILGMLWDSNMDTIMYPRRDVLADDARTVTKRQEKSTVLRYTTLLDYSVQ